MNIKNKIKKNIFFKKAVWPAYNMLQRLWGDDSYGTFVFYKPLNLLYIGIPKNANSTINRMFLKKLNVAFDEDDYHTIHKKKQEFAVSKNEAVEIASRSSVKTIAFARNPFSRLASCYINKIIEERSRPLHNEYWNLIYHKMPFDKFVNRIALIPDKLSNIHFRSQYSFLFHNNQPLFDYLGHIENLEEDLKPIIDEYDLPSIKSINVSDRKNSWRDLYSPELANKVHGRYEKDFKKLGYDNALRKIRGSLQK